MRAVILAIIFIIYLTVGAIAATSDSNSNSYQDSSITYTLPTHTVPEPGTLFLVALGVGLMLSKHT